jgi:RNA recognition motif. (a.k.a. RRM, RBD, or RNP domain)
MASDLRTEFSKFGPLDHLDHLPKKNQAFVEFVNLEGA